MLDMERWIVAYRRLLDRLSSVSQLTRMWLEPP